MAENIVMQARTMWGEVVEYTARHATALANGNGYDGPSDGNTRNAIAHAHASAHMAYTTKKNLAGVNAYYAEKVGDFKEWLPGGNDPNDVYKDQYNNEVGRRIAQYAIDNNLDEDAVDDLIIDALNNGHLILAAGDPNDPEAPIDPRITNELPPVWDAPSGMWEDAAAPPDYTGLPNPPKDWVPSWAPALEVLPPLVLDGLIPWGIAPGVASPICFDLDGDGIELTTFNASTTETFFDIDGDGFAEQTAWVGADDGLLARDLDESGTIDSVAELFGSPSVDGFALLAELDDNGDYRIDQYDAAWSDLVVWKDADGDAVTDSGELHTMASLNIVSIDLAGVAASSSTISGNPISHTSTYTLSGGTTRAAADAWFVHDDVNSEYVGDYTLDPRVMFLPTLRGYGEIADLHVAMSQDEGLLNLVLDFIDGWEISRFADAESLDSDVQDILWTWAGVEEVSSTSRGSYIDARKLEFLESFFGNDFLQNGINPNPHQNASAMLEEAYLRVFLGLKAQLIVQVGGAEIFDDTIEYDVLSGAFEGDMDLSQSYVDDLEAAAPAPGGALVAYWQQVALFLDATKGLANLTTSENTMMNDAIVATDVTLTWDEIKEAAPSYDDTIYGTSGVDSLYGGNGDDTIWGGAGNDNLYGQADNDILQGGYDDDNLYGGAGNDFAYGDYGNDSYHYESGYDFYQDVGGTDKIVMAAGIVAGDLSFYQQKEGTADGSLFIVIDGLGTIESKWFWTGPYSNLHSQRIETIQFSDTSTFNFNGLTAMTSYGGNEADYIYGVQFSSHLSDTIYGLGGNDQLYGQDGNDTLDGGDGNDILSGAAGNDTYIMSAGFDTIYWDSSGTDVLWVPDGHDAGDLTIRKSGTYDVIVSIVGLGQIKIEGQLYSGYSIETVSFNGSSSINLTTTQIEQVGTSSADSLSGITSGASIDDIMDGREGNDTLSGYYGDDTYFFSVGNDTINESGGSDVIRIREAWTPSTISVYRSGTALSVEDQNGNTITAGQHFTVESGGGNAAYEIEQIVFADNTVWTLRDIEIAARGTSGNDSISGTSLGDASSDDLIFGYAGNDGLNGGEGHDILYGGDGNDGLYGGNGNDRLYGEAGDDYLAGNGGDDVYYSGEGLDTVIDSAGYDTLHITGGTTINDISLSVWSAYHLKITIDASINEIILNSMAWSSDYHVEAIGFDDGFLTSLPDYASWLNGTSGNDTVAGNSGDNTMIGFAGNDNIAGGSGNDDMHGGAGNDTLDGDDGTDQLYGGDGDDILYGEGGLDTLHGGDGADTFTFFTASAFSNVDVIRDFSVVDDDVLDLTNILDTVYDPLTDDIADFISFSESSGSTLVSVDRDGTGGTYSMAQIVKLENVTGLGTPDLLETNGNLIAA